MRKSLLFSFLVLVQIVSCSKMSETVVNEPVGDVRIKVVALLGDATSTRTAVQSDGSSIYWTQGDAINLFHGSAGSGKFTASSITTPSASAEFEGELKYAGSTGLSDDAYWGVYPYDASNSCDGSSVTMIIPSAQKAADDTFADKFNPAVATGDGLNLTFYNVGAWFIFSVTEEGITSATLSGNGNEDLVGTVKVTMGSGGRPSTSVVSGVKTITMDAPEGGFVPGKQYYMVVIPQSLASGYTLSLSKGDLSADCVVDKAVEFKRAEYRRKKSADSGLMFGNIVFADETVKSICVSNWDTNGDGELSYSEAAAVSDIGTKFNGSEISSFDELQYFTSLKSLTGGAFQGSKLSSVVMPNSVETIKLEVFSGCSNLSSVTLSDNISSVPYRAFENCVSMKSITIPEGVTNIGSEAFWGCSELSSVNIPETVTRIEDSAFRNCSKLDAIIIPTEVSYIGEQAFRGCSKLKSVVIPEAVTEINLNLFSGCSSLFSVTIPETVTAVKSGAFNGCSSLTELVIPSAVVAIGDYAFMGCSSLESILFYPSTPPSGGTGMFSSTNCSIYVPAESLDAYKAVDKWSQYSDRIKPM